MAPPFVHCAFAFSKCNQQQAVSFAIRNHCEKQNHHQQHLHHRMSSPYSSSSSAMGTTTASPQYYFAYNSLCRHARSARTTTAAMASSSLSSSFDVAVAEFDSSTLAQSAAVMTDPTSSAATTTTTTFEPILNVPALIIFLVITLVFGFLQFRVAAIGQAVDKRTLALQRLRSVKSKQLSGELLLQQNDVDVKNNSSDNDNKVNVLVQEATEEYRQALEEVERLRTIIPGFARIAPPPAPTAIMEENVAAAKQFLGIDLESRSLLASPRGEQKTDDEKVKQKDSQVEQEQKSRLSSPILIAVLVAVGISQIGLLFLLSLDPMMPSSSNVFP